MVLKRPSTKSLKAVAPGSYTRLLGDVIELLETGRTSAGRAVNQAITTTYWLIGQRIVEHEQGGERRASYGDKTLSQLSIELTKRFGRGFSIRNLEQMRLFFLGWPITQTLSAESPSSITQTLSAEFETLAKQHPVFPLPWSHYVRLLSVRDGSARSYYESESVQGGWSARQLDRQIETLAYQRTKGRSKRSTAGPPVAEDVIREPFILEFLGLKDEYSENEMEEALIRELEHFLLELGNDFTFVARQKRLRVGDEWYRIDLLFFHRRLRCLVILDLKIGKFSHADAGQMNMYLNYAAEHWTHTEENPPVGLILCSEKDATVARYSLGNLTNKILATEYQLVLPKAEELRDRLKRARQLLAPASTKRKSSRLQTRQSGKQI